MRTASRRRRDFEKSRPGARFGGEELIVCLSGPDQDAAVEFAQTVRAAVEALAILHSSSTVSRFVTLSIGVAATIPRQGESYFLLIQEALYTAKRAGKNCVLVSGG